MNPNHAISVIMPVFNTEKYLGQAIESILDQEFDDFEFLIIDDGSTDNSLNIIQSYNDPRIKLIINKTNRGNYPARNKAIQLSGGNYICVMDSDDVALPGRLLTQFNFMEYNPYHVALGSFVSFLYANGSTRPLQVNSDEEDCNIMLLRDTVCIHPSLILRKEALVKNRIRYNEKYYYAADFDLLVQLSKVGNISNIPSFLLNYRIHPEQISRKKHTEQQIYADRIRISQLNRFRICPTQQECDLHLKLLKGKPLTDHEFKMAEEWTDKLLKQNEKLSLYCRQRLTVFLKEKLLPVKAKP